MAFADVEQGAGFILVTAWVVALVVFTMRPAGHMPAWAGKATAVGSGLAVVLFAAQAGVVDAVADPAFPAELDRPVLVWFVDQRSPAWTWLMERVSDIGGTAGMTVLAVGAAVVLWWRSRRVESIAVVIAAAGSAVLVLAGKTLYGRSRPPAPFQLVPEHNASLPSGHALGSVVVLGMLAAVIWRTSSSVLVRVAAVTTATATTALIGMSRLYLGVHWFTDVLTGWLLGATWLAVCLTVLAVRIRLGHGGAGLRAPAPTVAVSNEQLR
ncbi:phosphatase PAP2 family protein [Pseudonocardia alni]|uniref:phosphatase PAP2 family protein n=1 Tax=Pseudonocardia alni TaxID=33907 RepID=UPI0033CBEFE2